ncbi:MAG TPA: substrate-binding domain-containing protein [Steroidobacteraceae bacterium]|nr:substrate-binding domain-containing protein [Steroidobacteraceae bacterium]
MNTPSFRRPLARPVVLLAATLIYAPSLVCARSSSSLPEYRPERQVSGVIRSWGSRQMGGLMKIWEAGFRKYQPNVYFEDTLKGTASAQYGLQVNVADLALSARQIFPYEYYGIYRRSQLRPVEIAVATGSYDVPGKSTALAIFVNKDNPLSRLTLKQLDGIYGDQRTGGWQGLEWVTQAARSSKENIRTWGRLGLTGEWADKPIHVYGPPGLYPGGVSYFQSKVMGGADTWNGSLREFNDRRLMMAALAKDRYGIAYATMAYETAQAKSLALAETQDGPYVALTKANVANRTYPLARLAYIYFAPDRPNGDPADPKVDPKVKEFLRYILSRQGQRDVLREGAFLPLTKQVVREQLEKLDD